MKFPEIIITEDGSNSLFSIELNESYHSKFGAIRESEHVFIDAGLKMMTSKSSINILEIGFGTGLNAWLTLLESIERKIEIHYHTIEPFPIPVSIYSLLNFAEFIEAQIVKGLFTSLHESAWDAEAEINDFFKLNKQKLQLEDTTLINNFYDLVYYDAFSPEVQPELWTTCIFIKIFNAMKVNGIFVTYSAKGSVRRNLIEAGFEVERIPGPKGKREMIRAFKH
jgi:tRNA U34 5-methylaminomethyl-2-thiouridine-forming methyltransferase MnmC